MDFSLARRNMVASQIRTNEVTDPLVIDAMAQVPREHFLPAARQAQAYVDEDVFLAEGRWLMEPMVAARLLQLAKIELSDHVLVLPGGSGYLAAGLSHMASSVVAVEANTSVREAATKTLGQLGADTVALVPGEVTKGCPAQAPFDVIVFDGSVAEIPDGILDQLADGGRCVTVIQNGPIGRATLVERSNDKFGQREEFDASIPAIAEFITKPKFVF